ncbi:MAG: Phage terminase large subunit [Mucilaginibacter sp.]|nr:Phage terminase large subunit [Mucilaginibacter sp.]
MFNNQQATVLFKQNYHAEANTIINQGGSYSGKTFSIQQVLFCRACETEKQVITVVGQDIPNLKAGVLRDALGIYNSSETLQALVKSYNKTDRIFEFHNGSTEYFSANH